MQKRRPMGSGAVHCGEQLRSTTPRQPRPLLVAPLAARQRLAFLMKWEAHHG